MITLGILIFTTVVSLVAFYDQSVKRKLIFNPYMIEVRREWWRFFTCGFIHADFFHLLLNMLVLYSFGRITEFYFDVYFQEKGSYYFILLYVGAVVISITPSFKKHQGNPAYNSLGASGAVSAVLFSCILFQPLEKVCLYGFLCLPGIIMGLGYLIYSYYMDKRGGDNVNHDAHFWGAIYGIVFTVALKPDSILIFMDQLQQLLP